LTVIPVSVVLLSLRNITKHPEESPIWIAAMWVSVILICGGLSLLVWARFAKRA